MEIVDNLDKKINFQTCLLEYLDNEEDIEYNFQNLVEIFKKLEFDEKKAELREFLKVLIIIANNHHRSAFFLEKIDRILLHLTDTIKQSFSNFEIFNIFQKNVRILKFLSDNKILRLDKEIFYQISIQSNKDKFFQYFYTDLCPFIKEQYYSKYDYMQSIENLEEKIKISENDSYICSLIRNDSVKEFITYVNKNSISLTKPIEKSLFETNSFLIKNETTLIEYAAFFGSIQIFQYLQLNGVNLTPSLWLYAIHGKNAELIHLLESNQVEQVGDCIKEAIKCYHNDIANYLINSSSNNEDTDQKILEYGFHYYNYEFFANKINNCRVPFYLIKYNYCEIFKLFIEKKNFDINEKIIQIIVY